MLQVPSQGNIFSEGTAGNKYISEEPAATDAPLESPAGMEPRSTANFPDTSAPNSNLNHPNPPANHEPYEMFFQDYGVNPSVDIEDDHLSTFVLDVDSGSCTIMRNYLSEGNLPPADSVHVEEYVNHVDQGYPGPPRKSNDD